MSSLSLSLFSINSLPNIYYHHPAVINVQLRMLAPFGKFVTLGVPDSPLPSFGVGQFIANGSFFGASHTGSKADVEKMLALVAEKGIKPW